MRLAWVASTRGRVIEIYGPESSGKTTICLHAIAEAQKAGGMCGFIDVEHALDPSYAAKIGVDVQNLYVSQPDTGEQALEIAEALVRSGAMDVVVVDSVAALVPRAEIEGEMGDSHVGLQARLMSQALRKLTGVIKSSGTCMIFTNQLRQKIGVMFGNPETTSGGMALKFYASVRLDIRRIESIKQGTDVVGNRTRVTVKKNKVAPPFKVAEFDIMFNEGISTTGDLIDLGVEYDVITKRGAFFSFNEMRLGQGRENAKEFLRQNPNLRLKFRSSYGGGLGLQSVQMGHLQMVQLIPAMNSRSELSHSSVNNLSAETISLSQILLIAVGRLFSLTKEFNILVPLLTQKYRWRSGVISGLIY